MVIEKQDTADKLMKLIMEEFHVDRDQLQPQVTFQDLNADSLDMVQLIMKVEDTFNISIHDDDIEGLQRLQDFIDYVHMKRNEEAA
ncbi:MAG: acyl carrier protein [Candidatus Babeliales bacterium]